QGLILAVWFAAYGWGPVSLFDCVSLAPLLSPSCGPVSLFDCISLAHILALLGRAVKTRAILIVNVCLRIHPYQSMSPAWCRSRGASAAADRCCGRRRADWSLMVKQ